MNEPQLAPERLIKDERIEIRIDAKTVQALHDLKILYPGKKKAELIRQAILEKLARDSR